VLLNEEADRTISHSLVTMFKYDQWVH